jgi:mannosyltransferase
MATGVPVVATDVGAFSELVVDGETGSLIPRDDSPEMIAAAASFMDNERVREAASLAALQRARRDFPLAREAERINRVYESVWERCSRGAAQ